MCENKNYFSSIAYILLYLLMTACSGSDPVDTTGSISGSIHDALSNEVLQGVSVTLSPSGRSAVTGTDGHYLFQDVETGSYTVSVSRTDYLSDSKSATVTVGQNTRLDFSLRRAASALVVEPLTLDFGETDTQLSLNIKNKGQGTMTWQITENTTWLTCIPTSGTVLAGQTGAVAVAVDRTGLSRGTYSNTLVVASNDGGSQIVRITMVVGSGDGGVPQVSMISVSGETDISATFKGTIVKTGASRVTSHGFCWSTDDNPSLGNGDHCDLGYTDDSKDFTYSATSLQPNQHYYVRAYATNATGTAYSSTQQHFTTLPVQGTPTIETGGVLQVSADGASVTGTVSDLGCAEGVNQHGHVWSNTTQVPTVDDYDKTELGIMKETGSFTSTLTNLHPNTLYYVRAYAHNKYGTNYGEVIQLNTLRAEVKLSTSSVTDIIHNEATCGGVIADLGGNNIVERGVCWSTNPNPTMVHNHAVSTDQTDRFSVRLTNLSEKTVYHVRAYVKTETGETYYGQDVYFQTTQVITFPVLSAVSVSNVTYKNATFMAKINSLGNGTLKRSGFCYAVGQLPTINNYTLDCAGAVDLQATAKSLAPVTTYYVRAFAENEMGLVYSEELSFTTKEKTDSGNIEHQEWGDDETWD